MENIMKETGRSSLFEDAVRRMSMELKFSRNDSEMLLVEFVNSLKEYIDEFDESINSLEWDKLTRAAHSLKGLSSNMRVEPLFLRLSDLEMASKGNKVDLCREKIDEIKIFHEILLKDV